jgi:hypothetical protein
MKNKRNTEVPLTNYAEGPSVDVFSITCYWNKKTQNILFRLQNPSVISFPFHSAALKILLIINPKKT